MKILLANDDGINSPGLRAMFFALKELGHEVEAVAPSDQQSGVSRSITVFSPLRVMEIRDCEFYGRGVTGRPADCVKLALGELLSWKPDLVVSGINNGPNTGVEIYYSGTIGAASEACHTGIPVLALSHAGKDGNGEWNTIAKHAARLANKIDWSKIPSRRVISVNYPAVKFSQIKGLRICPLTDVIWSNSFNAGIDPFGDSFWWINGTVDNNAIRAGTDRDLLQNGYITITPLQFKLEDSNSLKLLESMNLDATLL